MKLSLDADRAIEKQKENRKRQLESKARMR